MARDWISDPEVKASIRSNHKKVRAMTDTPTTSVQPVRAWAVVDKDGKFNCLTIFEAAARADPILVKYDEVDWPRAPHRIIRVEIRGVNDE